jgi:hypothetical protein
MSASVSDSQRRVWVRLGRSEVLVRRRPSGVRYSAPDSARKAIAGDCLRVGDLRSWTATCSRNRHDPAQAHLDEPDQCTFADSHMPTHVHKLDRCSAIKRRTNRGGVQHSTATAKASSLRPGRHVLCAGPRGHLTLSAVPPALPIADSSHLPYRHRSLYRHRPLLSRKRLVMSSAVITDDLDLLHVPPLDFEIRCAIHLMHRRK